jgi:hypothetical protein
LTPPLRDLLGAFAADRVSLAGGATVLVTPRHETSSSVVALLLDDAGTPALVAKLPRLPDLRDGIVREEAVLREIQSRRPTTTVPSVVELASLATETMLVETALVGETITPTELRRRPQRAVDDVLRWLLELPAPRPEPARIDLLVDGPLTWLETLLPPDAPERQLVARSLEAVEPLRGVTLPAVVEHGDLSHPNLIRLRDGRLGVVDWELGETAGLPMCDLCFFLGYLAATRRRASRPRQLAAAFDGAFASPDAWARPPVRSYAGRLGLEASLLGPLLAATWARYAVRIVARIEGVGAPAGLTADGEVISPVALAALRESPQLALWQRALDASPRLARWL